MKIAKPAEEQIPRFYRKYINSCPEDDLIEALERGLEDFTGLVNTIPTDKENYRYGEGKWSLKEVISHMTDAERVFSYRALRFSRKDPTPMPGFDENFYVPNSNAGARNISSLKKEFEQLRLSNIEMYKGMTADMLDFEGTANESKISARTNGWIIAGHARHHCKVIREMYLT